MSEILDRTAYQRPTSFSEVRGDPARDDDRRASRELSSSGLGASAANRRIIHPSTFFFFLLVHFPSHSPSDHPRPLPVQATGRIQKNLNYFKINYFLFTAAVLAFFIITNPTSLLVLGALAGAWTYVYLVRTEPLKIGERPISDREKLLGMSGGSLLAIFFMSSAGSLMFQAFGVALLAVGAHGAMRVPDDLFVDDASADGGFFSFLQPPRPGLTGSVA